MQKYSKEDYNDLVSIIINAIDEANSNKTNDILKSFIYSSSEPFIITKEKIIHALKEREFKDGLQSTYISDPNHIVCLKIPTALMFISELQIEANSFNEIKPMPQIETIINIQQHPVLDQKKDNDDTQLENVEPPYRILDNEKFGKIMKHLSEIGWCDKDHNWIDRTQGYKNRACCLILWMQSKRIISNSLVKEIHLIANSIFNVDAGESTARNAILKHFADEFEKTFKNY